MDSNIANLLDISSCSWQSGDSVRHGEPNIVPHDAKHAPQKGLEFVLARSGYRVRHARSRAQRRKACALIKSMYAWRGYVTDSAAALPHNPNYVTLEASTKKKLFGTLTVGLDSADGLFADELYRREINVLRRAGHRVCEMTRLAFNPQYSSKEVIASLFHLAYLHAHAIHDATDILIEVNPRHASFYQRRLGFKQIGEPRTCTRVNATAILLNVPTDYMASQISRHAGSCDASEKSLYPCFFSAAEVSGLISRMARARLTGKANA